MEISHMKIIVDWALCFMTIDYKHGGRVDPKIEETLPSEFKLDAMTIKKCLTSRWSRVRVLPNQLLENR